MKDKNETITHQKFSINNNIICKLFPIKNSIISQTIIALFDIIDKYELVNSTYSTTWFKYSI